MNNNKQRTLTSHHKTPSLLDLLQGRRITKTLPENFYEKVLELEIRLKKGFNMNVLQELVNYYSVNFMLT